MNKNNVFPVGQVYNNIADALAALLKRISQSWNGPQLQPIPVKAKN